METVKHAKTSNKLPASARIMDNTFFCFCTSLCSKSSWLARSHSLCLSSLIRAVCVLVPGALAYGKISWCFDNPQELVCIAAARHCVVPNQARHQFCSNHPHLLLWRDWRRLFTAFGSSECGLKKIYMRLNGMKLARC